MLRKIPRAFWEPIKGNPGLDLDPRHQRLWRVGIFASLHPLPSVEIKPARDALVVALADEAAVGPSEGIENPEEEVAQVVVERRMVAHGEKEGEVFGQDEGEG